MKILKTAIFTCLTLCFISTGAMATIVKNYSNLTSNGTTYDQLTHKNGLTDTVSLSGLGLTAGDALEITASFTGTQAGEIWSLYTGEKKVGDLNPWSGTDPFTSQVFTLLPYNFSLDSITLGLVSSGKKPDAGMKIDYFEISKVSSVPAPAAFWLFGSGLLGLAMFKRNRQG